MVFQEQSVLPNCSVAENIMLGYEDDALRYGVYNWGKLNGLAAAQLAKLDSKISATAQVGCCHSPIDKWSRSQKS